MPLVSWLRKLFQKNKGFLALIRGVSSSVRYFWVLRLFDEANMMWSGDIKIVLLERSIEKGCCRMRWLARCILVISKSFSGWENAFTLD